MSQALTNTHIENAARDAGLGHGIDGHTFRSLIREGRRQITRRVVNGMTNQQTIGAEVAEHLRNHDSALSIDARCLPTFADWLTPWLIDRLAIGGGDDS